MEKKVLFLLYPGFADFEINILSMAFHGNEPYRTVTASLREHLVGGVTGAAGMTVMPQVAIEEVDPNEYEALVIPGGEPLSVLANEQLRRVVQGFHEAGKYLGAICAGPAVLADAGVLDQVSYTTSLTADQNPEYRDVFPWEGKKEEHVVTDGRIVTAIGSAYVEFAGELLEKMEFFEQETEKQEFLNFFKNRV